MKSPDEQALAALRAFAGELLANWPDEVGIDGFELQDLCVKHGLLVAAYPKKPCMDGCWCEGYYGSGLWEGAVCYRKTELLIGNNLEENNG